MIKSERKKQTMPFFSTSEQKMIEMPFTLLDEVQEKGTVRVRMANGMEKDVSRKIVYYEVGPKETSAEEKQGKKER